MLRRPRFKAHLRVEVVPGEGVFLLSEQQQVVLQGRLYELVAPALDGRSTEEICDQLRGRASAARVFYTLAQLEKRGCLGEAADVRPAAESALWAEQQIDPGVAAHRLADTTVEVRAAGAVDTGPLCDLLRSLGVQTKGVPALTVVAADSYLRGDLRACNEKALRDGRPWLLVKPIGRRIWLGPLFVPGKTGCWACLAERLQANAPVLAYLEAKRGHTGEAAAHHAGTPATMQAAWALAATAIASWVVRGDLPHLEGKVQSLDVLTAESHTHLLVRLPFCPVCGGPAPVDRPLPPLVVGSGKKTFTEDGGHRVCSPEQTLERYGHHVATVTMSARSPGPCPCWSGTSAATACCTSICRAPTAPAVPKACAACGPICAAPTPARGSPTPRPGPVPCARPWSATRASSAALSRAAGPAWPTWGTLPSTPTPACSSATGSTASATPGTRPATPTT
jgi:ribosomal protein S12 methylthiotransferase accessory factor